MDSFIKWDNDGTDISKPQNFDVHFLINDLTEDINTFLRRFQEIIQTYSLEDQVWKAKLKSWPKPAKVGFIMYSVHSLQVKYLVQNAIKIIEMEQGQEI